MCDSKINNVEVPFELKEKLEDNQRLLKVAIVYHQNLQLQKKMMEAEAEVIKIGLLQGPLIEEMISVVRTGKGQKRVRKSSMNETILTTTCTEPMAEGKNCSPSTKRSKRSSTGKDNKRGSESTISLSPSIKILIPLRKVLKPIDNQIPSTSSNRKSNLTSSSTSSRASSVSSWASSERSSESSNPSPCTSPMQQPEFLAVLGLCTLQVREELKTRRTKRTRKSTTNDNFYYGDLRVYS
ncbi:hypothetical protein HHI36_002412 [Cryptolaemus montrouzieri]|uniref:Uncharacterized protein n=1 Tax=Cryptolaemus montrouzieri TaxID=559131 RepID=A0ABD2PAE2_9CUCU